MKANIIAIVLLVAACQFAFAQPEGCDQVRYRTAVFDDVVVTEAVKFGENTTIGNNFQELFMDVYEPAGDQQATRPAVVVAFGGAFVTGNRQSMAGICESLARKGYVAVTIDYRLFDFGIPLDTAQMLDVVVKAVGDMKAAIRFLREDAATDNQFGIDTNYIFVGGISAGAITACHAAYLDENDVLPSAIESAINENGGLEGNSSDNVQYSSSVQGVVNYSGALKAASLISTDEAPILSVHDDGDDVVPYENASVPAGPFITIYLEGSASLHAQADALDIMNELITIDGSNGHVSYFSQNAAEYEMLVDERTANFLADIMCGPLSNTEAITSAPLNYNLYPNPVSTRLNIQLDHLSSSYSIRIIDGMGRTVFEEANVSNAMHSLSLASLSGGLYTMQLHFEGHQHQGISEKIVVIKH